MLRGVAQSVVFASISRMQPMANQSESFRGRAQAAYRNDRAQIDALHQRILYVCGKNNWGARDLAKAGGRARFQAYRWTDTDDPATPQGDALDMIADAGGVDPQWLAEGKVSYNGSPVEGEDKMMDVRTYLHASAPLEHWPTSTMTIPRAWVQHLDVTDGSDIEAALAPVSTHQVRRNLLIFIDLGQRVHDLHLVWRNDRMSLDVLGADGVLR